ncbi:insulin receptor substrate 1 isoform X1 [Folsomia candida]|uniref:insulin receptor substrate 1 isoform X1 n=1 Tax=Folsomia candida TaxID=158441 RepID=UPI001604CCF1|nr:insulin receptor substrate 1 isoform X1 [Folsomia candida]
MAPSISRLLRDRDRDGPSPNHSKMSVTNEDVSGGAHNMTGEGGTTPTAPIPRQTVTSSASSSTLGSTTSPGVTSVVATPTSLNNGMSSGDDVAKSGYLRKLKGKKKFFVLRKETDADKPARLEYYAKEKNFRMGHPPRKSIGLKACFNIIGPESNLKSKYSVSLHTYNDCVRISMISEEEANEWLRAMKSLAGEEEDDQVVEGKPHFEHIWMVQVLNKGLGSKENIIGPYRLCLTSKELTLLKVGEHDGRNGQVRFPLNVIRNVSHDATLGCFFHIELGRLACIGPGQLSLKTDDNNITQNMHLVILKAMQNYSKDDIIPPRERARTYTWTNDATMRSSHSTTPAMSSSIDEPRTRTDSMPSSAGRVLGIGMSQMSPPVPIHTSTPSILFNSPNMYSTGDSASSSYSIDYDNNNHSHGGSILVGDKSNDEEEYVPFNPTEDQHLIISPKNLMNMKLPLIPDISDYVESGKDSASSNAQTPSSYMEMQSPMSPFDNYIPMSPACTIPNGLKSNGKISVSHSRNSSLIEDNDGYVPMIPGGVHSRSESGAGSTAGSATGLDDAYLDMDFTRKINLSNEDVRRVSPASSESLQSNTPSSDFPLEKVTSYLTDDFEDSMRPIRAYSVGSRSDTSALGKIRSGKNRLEAVQETFRCRAMSVGSKNPRKPPILPNTSSNAGLIPAVGSNKAAVSGVGPLSSSWSGSTGRWPMTKFVNNHHYSPNQPPTQYAFSQGTSESNDSDLMELDFSKNKKIRKRSHPGPPPSLNSTPSSTGSSSLQKISPVPKGVISNNSGAVEGSESSELLKSSSSQQNSGGSAEYSTKGRNYAISAPISIKAPSTSRNTTTDPNYAYHDASSSQASVSILSRLTGTDLKKLKELDDEGAYLNMDFSKPPVASKNDGPANNFITKNKIPSTTAIRSDECVSNAISPSSTKFCLNLTSPSMTSLNLTKPEAGTGTFKSNFCNGDLHTSSSKNPHPNNDKNHPPVTKSSPCSGCSDHLVISLPTCGLTRMMVIEESPEKQEHSKPSSGSITPQSPSRCAPLAKPEDDNQITYASIEHLPPPPSSCLPTGLATVSCATAVATSNKVTGVAYAQIDFKSTESVKPNS